MKFQRTVYVSLPPQDFPIVEGMWFSLFQSDMSAQGYTIVAQVPIEFEVDAPSATFSAVQVLKEGLEQLRAENAVKENAIQSRINSLLALENHA